MAKNLGLRGHVKFLNRFLSKPELINYLQATDVYITPYLSPNQVSSGTLSYALAAGKAVVSTPYLHAKEALGEGRGVFCDFNDSASIAEKVTEIIENQKLRESLEQKAYTYSRKFTWPLVAKKYLTLFDELTRQSGGMAIQLPRIKIDYLQTFTDDTGVFQHAKFCIPKRNEGYTTDDNARALIACTRYYRLKKDPT